MTNKQLPSSIDELKAMWVIGSLERLATLGLLYQTPYVVAPESIDVYLEIDEMRHKLFPVELELKQILKCILSETTDNVDPNILDQMYTIILDYKNNREKLVKRCLENSIS
jgi:hypothetical protein